MSYLEKIVGLSGATSPAPQPGVRLVNDLPIITDSFAKGVSKSDDINEVWQRVIKNAEDLIEMDLYCEISKDDRFRQLMAITQDFGYSSAASVPASSRYEGARIRTQRQKDTTLYIKSIYVAGSGSFVARIFDLTTGQEVHTQEAVTITNEGYIHINKKLSIDKLKNSYFVGVEAIAELASIGGNKGFIGDRCSNYPVDIVSGSLDLTTDKTEANFTPNRCLVHVEAEIASSMSGFISNNTDLFSLTAQYLCGSLLLNEGLTSDRFNLWTNTNRQVKLTESLRQEDMYKSYLKKTVQQVLMRLAPTNIVAPKAATEKAGVYTESLVDEGESDYFRGLDGMDLPLNACC